MKVELLHCDDGLLRACGHYIVRREDPQAFARNRQAFDERNL